MGKISPVSGKYIVHATIAIDGVVDRPDVIGAIFGQTEGLLGSELELRELQRSGRIGRIEVITDNKGGKTRGTITIPSSLDKSETAIIGAALEVIERIGPCNAEIKVQNIEDIRVSKRNLVITRAKQLLRGLMDSQMPDSQEIADEVAESVRIMEITQYGRDKLPAGPLVEESEEIIVVEGRADVLTLLKHGFKNAIAMNGSNAPSTIVDLCKEKIVTVFIDGDRGGDLNVKELASRTEIDYVCRAPDGKEVEELTKKEIHKALRSKIALEQALSDISMREKSNGSRGRQQHRQPRQTDRRQDRQQDRRSESSSSPSISKDEKARLSTYLETLIGTHGAFVLDQQFEVLGKVPRTELESTLGSIDKGSVHAVVVDGIVDQELVDVARSSNVKYLLGMDSDVKRKQGISIMTAEQLA
jgi:DNA primase